MNRNIETFIRNIGWIEEEEVVAKKIVVTNTVLSY